MPAKIKYENIDESKDIMKQIIEENCGSKQQLIGNCAWVSPKLAKSFTDLEEINAEAETYTKRHLGIKLPEHQVINDRLSYR